MNKIKLFKFNEETWNELEYIRFPYELEKELQKSIEDHMKTFLGINFVGREYLIEKAHRKRRIDSVGIDEDNRPVIIEYKRLYDKDIIGQVVQYRTLFKKDKSKFHSLVINKLNKKYAGNIKWPMTRVLCIARDFLPEDEDTAKENSIELIRYKKYGNDILLFDFIDSKDADEFVSVNDTNDVNSKKSQKQGRKTFEKHRSDLLEGTDENLKDLYYTVEDFIKSLGDDIKDRETDQYEIFKRSKIFVYIQIVPRKKCFYLRLNLDPKKFHLEGITRDVSDGHHKTCLLRAEISNIDDFEKTKHLIIKSYEAS